MNRDRVINTATEILAMIMVVSAAVLYAVFGNFHVAVLLVLTAIWLAL